MRTRPLTYQVTRDIGPVGRGENVVIPVVGRYLDVCRKVRDWLNSVLGGETRFRQQLV